MPKCQLRCLLFSKMLWTYYVHRTCGIFSIWLKLHIKSLRIHTFGTILWTSICKDIIGITRSYLSKYCFRMVGEKILYQILRSNELKIRNTLSKAGKIYKNYFSTSNHQLFHMYVGTYFKIHTQSTICMIPLKPHVVTLSAWIIYTIFQQVMFTAISRIQA